MDINPINPMYADNCGNPNANGIKDKIMTASNQNENALSCAKVRTKYNKLNKKKRIDEIPLKIIDKIMGVIVE